MCGLGQPGIGPAPKEKVDSDRPCCAGSDRRPLGRRVPLVVFQTGPARRTNMNATKVIANRAIQLAACRRFKGSQYTRTRRQPQPIIERHFPTAMHIATVEAIEKKLFPAVNSLRDVLDKKSQQYRQCGHGPPHAPSGRHASNIGQLISGWAAQSIRLSTPFAGLFPGVYALAIGGTGRWPGLNADPRFAEVAARRIAEETSSALCLSSQQFAALSAHDGL